MSEWKRVFCHPERMALLALMTFLCAGLYFISLMERVGPEGAGNVLAAGAYASRLTERLRVMPVEKRTALMDAERKRLEDFYWYWYDGSGFDSEAEALASVADVPGLADAARRGDLSVLNRSFRAQLSVLDDVSAQIEHTAGYAAYLDEIRTRAEVQSQTSLFGRAGSFARRNLVKTAEDFKSLLGVEAEFGNSRGMEKWLRFQLGDYFHLIAMILFVMAFLEERKKGLWPIVRATRGGRVRLGLTRIGILLAGSTLAVALFNVIPFVLSMAINGGWTDLGRSLQSLESFGSCTLRISIAGWLALYFALKALSGVLIGLLLWCLLGSVANIQFSLSALGAILAGEFALYAFLPVQSVLNVFKYFNIFSLVHTITLYTEYLNVDLFGFPVGIRVLTLGTAPVLLAVLTAWALHIQRDRRPEGNRDRLSGAVLWLDRRLDVFRERFSLGGWEAYKVLVFQHGVFLLALVVLVTGGLNYLYAPAPTDFWYNAYLEDMEGPVTAATDDYMTHAGENAAVDQNAEVLLPALERVAQRVADLRQRAENGGYEPWIVDDFDYEIGYGSQNRDVQRFNAAVAVTMTALLAAPLWAFERQAGVTSMLRSTSRGRKRLSRRKTLTAALLAAFVWGCVYLREIVFVARYDSGILDSLAAPVRNLDALAHFPAAALTLGQYLAILYALRLVMLIGVGEAAMTVGLFCPNVRAAYVAAAALLGLPALLTALGAEIFKWVSPVIPVASAELLEDVGSGSLLYILPWFLWLAVSSAGLYLIHRLCGK